MNTPILSLHELNQLIRETIEAGFPETCLVTAEIASLREDRKGHCYLELVERDEQSIIAQIRATIWSYNYRVISRQFRAATGTPITKGIKILAEVEVTFHERYGLSLNILDIDPSYTMGEMARRRKEILDRLEKEGLIHKNRDLDFPVLPLNIAVISSEKAAGYEDFMNHVTSNPYGYRFNVQLLRAVMQGDNAESSILDALARCSERGEFFDLAVIIRGGGGEADLHCFDSYEMGRAIANLPVPLIAGIGHHRDRTVVDEVAHTSVKTPTAAAELVIQAVREFELVVTGLEGRYIHASRSFLEQLNESLHRVSREMEHLVTRFLAVEGGELRRLSRALMSAPRIVSSQILRLETLKSRCESHARFRVQQERQGIEHAAILIRTHLGSLLNRLRAALDGKQMQVSLLDPANVLKRGYSITYCREGVLKDSKNAAPGDIIRTILYSGEVKSRVTEVKGDGKEETAEVQGSDRGTGTDNI